MMISTAMLHSTSKYVTILSWERGEAGKGRELPITDQ